MYHFVNSITNEIRIVWLYLMHVHFDPLYKHNKSICWTLPIFTLAYKNKKAFQSNPDHPFSVSLCFTVNKFECVRKGVPEQWRPSWTRQLEHARWERGVSSTVSAMLNKFNMSGEEDSCTVRSNLNKFENVWGKGLLYSEFEAGALYNDPLEQTDRHDWKHYLPVTSLAGGIKN